MLRRSSHYLRMRTSFSHRHQPAKRQEATRHRPAISIFVLDDLLYRSVHLHRRFMKAIFITLRRYLFISRSKCHLLVNWGRQIIAALFSRSHYGISDKGYIFVDDNIRNSPMLHHMSTVMKYLLCRWRRRHFKSKLMFCGIFWKYFQAESKIVYSPCGASRSIISTSSPA